MTGKPETPMVGCDVFILNDNQEVLLVRRSDNGLWALPGGCQDLDETPGECAVRECKEETGYDITVNRLSGVFSSLNYEYIHYPWKENVFTHILFSGTVTGGSSTPSEETSEVAWFPKSELPTFSDGHEGRVREAFRMTEEQSPDALFE